MVHKRRPLRSVSLVFGGFVTLALLSQLSSHFFAAAIPKHLLERNAEVLSSIQQTSTQMAFAASALGLVFAAAALIITRQVVSADVDIYRATGLSSSSAYVLLLRSHSVRPLEWMAVATVVTSLVDLYFGLNALVPIGLAVSFAVLLLVWLAFLTSASFAQKDFQGRFEGRVG